MNYPFNVPPLLGSESAFVSEAIQSHKICGDGDFTKKCHSLLSNLCHQKPTLLTTSCTHALEMTAILADIHEGDEVIMPSFTFVSTANAFALRGAKCVFVDVRPDTMNLNERLIENAITPRTKAIVPVHYAGVPCEMDSILSLAQKYNLWVIEDAAQAVTSTYKGKQAGAIGHMGCFSFHETKNFSMGEGGAIVLSNQELLERAEIIREKGTNRSRYFRGFVDKYTLVDIGSSYLPSELNAAYLYGQLLEHQTITANRMQVWQTYRQMLEPLEQLGRIALQHIPSHCTHNAHMFYVKLQNLEDRTKAIEFLKSKGIQSVFHYIPLHSSPAGQRLGHFVGEDEFTTKESEKLLRLPLYYGLTSQDASYIAEQFMTYLRN